MTDDRKSVLQLVLIVALGVLLMGIGMSALKPSQTSQPPLPAITNHVVNTNNSGLPTHTNIGSGSIVWDANKDFPALWQVRWGPTTNYGHTGMTGVPGITLTNVVFGTVVHFSVSQVTTNWGPAIIGDPSPDMVVIFPANTLLPSRSNGVVHLKASVDRPGMLQWNPSTNGSWSNISLFTTNTVNDSPLTRQGYYRLAR